MRLVLPLLAVLLIGGSGAAGALSAIPRPTGNENPFSLIFAFFVFMALIYGLFLAVDWLARRAVGHMEERHDVEGLTRALKSPWLAGKAAGALGDMGEPEAVGPLMEALGDDRDDVRQAAAKALGDIGDARAIGPLTRTLGDRYRGVRDCASYALRKIREPHSSP